MASTETQGLRGIGNRIDVRGGRRRLNGGSMAKGKYEYWLTKDGLLLLEGWARDGLTDEQIARNAGITAGTLYEWKKKFEQISEALKKGKEVVDYEVENALVRRALGYKYQEQTFERVWNEKLERYIKVNTKTTTKIAAPDVGAICFWLKNRRPKNWRDRPDLQADNETLAKVDAILASMTREAGKNNYGTK